ncbi:MAG: DUF2085 domain-containing protein [Chloroflexi bacterium]|nr:DUF2085 domain-containing protein [Chloroflexota bacterium]
MEPVASLTSQPRSGLHRAHWLALIAFGLVFVSWLLYAPAGLLGKADAVGYAVCHRIDGRSFHIGNIQMPLCARCTGIYLGVALGVAAMVVAGRGRAGALPPLRVIITLILFIVAMGLDGVNSFLTLLPRLPHVYEPQNWLRLVTGTLDGVAMAVLIFPMFNQTLWRNWEDRPVIANMREVGVLVLLAAVVIALVLSDNAVILYPLALISVGGVVLLLTLTNSMLFMLITRTENKARAAWDALLPLTGGLVGSFALILLIDVVRFVATGAWGGFIIPGA